MLPKISLSGSLRIEAGDKLTIGDDPTVYRVEAVDKHGDITAFSIFASESSQQTSVLEPPQRHPS